MSFRTILAILWTMGLLIAFLVPAHWLRVVATGPHPLTFFNADKVVHCILFAGFAFLWMQAARTRRAQVGVFVAGVALAVLTEVAQGLPFIARGSDPADGLADLVGLIFGLAVAYGLNRCLRGREVRPLEAVR